MRFDPKLPDERVNVSPQHPLRDAALLVAGVCAVSIFAVVAISLTIDLLVPYLPASIESKVFATLGYEADEDVEIESDARTRQLQAMLVRLAAHWLENPYAFRLELLDEDELNAFAVPGGTIVITRGLLEDRSNRIQERIFEIILAEGADTIIDADRYEIGSFEKKMGEHPKLLLKFS